MLFTCNTTLLNWSVSVVFGSCTVHVSSFVLGENAANEIIFFVVSGENIFHAGYFILFIECPELETQWEHLFELTLGISYEIWILGVFSWDLSHSSREF